MAEEYINMKNVENEEPIVSEQEINKLLEAYDRINKIGTPFMIDHYWTMAVGAILMYMLVGIVWMKLFS